MKWIYIVENTLEKQKASLTHVLEFCHTFTKIDDIILICQADPSALSRIGDCECSQIKPIHIRPHSLGFILNRIKAFFYLRKLIKIQKPEVIYERAARFSLGPLLVARFNHISAILELNGNWEDEKRLALKRVAFLKKFTEIFTHKLRNYSLYIACQIATQLIVVSPAIATFLHKKGIRDKGKILVVANGVNLERFTPTDMAARKKDLGLDTLVNYIGFMGNLSAWQGVEDLILAYFHLGQQLSNIFSREAI